MLELLDVAPAVKARLRNIAVQRGLLMQEEAVKAEVVKYCNWTPTPKQRELIGCNAVECLYGGTDAGNCEVRAYTMCDSRRKLFVKVCGC